MIDYASETMQEKHEFDAAFTEMMLRGENKPETRNEEIQQASFEYHSKPYLGAIKDDFVNGAKWADETMIDRACDWLEDNIYDYLYINRDFNLADYKKDLIEDFKKSMKN